MQSKRKILILFFYVLFTFFSVDYFNQLQYDIQIKRTSEDNWEEVKKAIKYQENLNFNRRIEFYKRKYKVKNIVACVFYGRKMYTEILFRYLDRHLKKNGGILDKIIILNHIMGSKGNITIESEFLRNYLDTHVDGYEEFKFRTRDTYQMLYSVLNDDDLIFKIDDDIVFIANNTFENMVEDYFTNDRFILSANVINHHTLSSVHAYMNMMLPFYESANKNYTLNLDDGKSINNNLSLFKKCVKNQDMWRKNEKCSVIAHESFLYNIYRNNFNLDSYNFQFFKFFNKRTNSNERWRINFILFRGKDLNKISILYPNVSDEEIITVLLTNIKNKFNFALGSAIVSHFSYYEHINYLKETNILKKYDKLSLDYFK